MLQIADKDIGGARVRRIFTMGSRTLRAGDELTGDEVRSIPSVNRNALIETQHIELWLKPNLDGFPRHVVHRGEGRYDVVAGEIINNRPLNKVEAHELAAHAAN